MASAIMKLILMVIMCLAALKWPLIMEEPTWMWDSIIFSLILLTASIIYWVQRPLNIIRPLENNDEDSRRILVNLTRRLKSAGEKMPPAFPNGWFCLAESRFLKPGQVIGVNALGQQLVIFRSRTSDATVHVFDAYCPHMGADLSVGGQVVNGDCLQCPFHGWTYRGQDGKCVATHARDVPDFAYVKKWTSVEKNGHVYVWFHCENEEPAWQVPDLEEIANGQWTYRGRTEHYVKCHIQDIPENGADVAHLNFLHRLSILFGSDLTEIDLNADAGAYGEHKWTAEWQRQPAPNQHIGIMRLHHRLEIFGYKVPFTDFKVEARQIGPGVVYLLYDAGFLGRGVFVQHVTPLEPLLQKLIHHIYAERKTPTFLAKFFLWAETQQVERDIMIWNSKGYLKNQILIKEDSLIQRHRRWFSQFYTDNSPTIDEYIKNHVKHLDF